MIGNTGFWSSFNGQLLTYASQLFNQSMMAGFAVQLSLTFSDLNGHSSFSNIGVKYSQLLEGSDQFKHT